MTTVARVRFVPATPESPVQAYHFTSTPTRMMRPCRMTDSCRYVAAPYCVELTAVLSSEFSALKTSSFGVNDDVRYLKFLLTPRSTWVVRGVNSVPGATSGTLNVAAVRPGMISAPGVQLPLQLAGYVAVRVTCWKVPWPFS